MRGRRMEILTAFGIVIAIFFTLIMAYFPDVLAIEQRGASKAYEQTLFNKMDMMTVDILMDEEEWEDMLENAMEEEYYSCAITINGTTYQNVGIRPKGNTSLSQIASDDTTDRYSFKIEFDHYLSNQTCDGLDKLCLNNIMADATYMKEYISYDILNYLDVPSSLYTYANVTLNGEPWGLYLALEAVEESFMERNFGTSYGKLYKPETSMGGGMRDGSGGSDLMYTDDAIESYATIFDSAVFQVSDSDKKRVIKALKNITDGNDLESSMDVDEMLRYIAANVFLLNDDSYFGTMLHNYYLYEKDGKLSMLPWDYNLAFGGFMASDATSLVNRPIDDVVSGTTLESRPMVGKLLQKETYFKQYYAYLDELISGYFESGQFEKTVSTLRELLDEYIKQDATAFYSYDEYLTAQENFLNFCMLRAESIRGQLDGTVPSSTEEQKEEGAIFIDASSISIQVMGTQGGGKGGERMAMDRSKQENANGTQDVERMGGWAEEGQEKADVQAVNNMMTPSEQTSQEMESPAEGSTKPEEGDTISQGIDKNMQPGDSQMPDEQNGWGMGRPNNMGFSNEQTTETDNTEAYILTGVSFLVIVLGLLFACLYPRRRF